MPDADSTTPRPRRTARQLEEQILEAAWAELVEHGWSGLRMEAVAKRAAVSKASLYERWPSRGVLVRAAMMRDQSRATRFDDLPLAGDLEANLRAVLELAADYLTTAGGEAMRGIVSDAVVGRTVIAEEHLGLIDRVLDQAQIDGELGPEPIALLIRNAGIAIVVEHFLFLGAPPPPEQIALIVTDLWAPALRRASNSRGRS